ncbi:hypothetical protein Tcan_00931, partial [Toxocara canis]
AEGWRTCISPTADATSKTKISTWLRCRWRTNGQLSKTDAESETAFQEVALRSRRIVHQCSYSSTAYGVDQSNKCSYTYIHDHVKGHIILRRQTAIDNRTISTDHLLNK